MIKRFICILISIIIVFSGCSKNKYDNWIVVEMKKCGTVAFPEEWRVREEDGFYIISDKQNVKFIGYECNDYEEEENIDFNVSGYAISIENRDDIDFCTSEVFSNSAIWGKKPIICNGNKIEETYYVNLDNDESEIEYICVNQTDIDDSLVMDIAKSFCME